MKQVFIWLGLILIVLVLGGLTYLLLRAPTGQSGQPQILDTTIKGAIIGAGAAILGGIIGGWVQSYGSYYFQQKQLAHEQYGVALDWARTGRALSIRGAVLQGADLSGVDLGAVKEGDKGADLSLSNLEATNLRGTSLQETNLQSANLRHADLRGANLRRANLRFANLRSACLHRPGLDPGLVEMRPDLTTLEDAELREAHLQRADLREAWLHYAALQGSHLDYARLEKADLSSSHLEKAHLKYARLEGANLRGASLDEADLADLRGANLQNASLNGANLTDALLTDAKLAGIKYSKNTLLPDQFNLPSDAALVEEDREVRINGRWVSTHKLPRATQRWPILLARYWKLKLKATWKRDQMRLRWRLSSFRRLIRFIFRSGTQ